MVVNLAGGLAPTGGLAADVVIEIGRCLGVGSVELRAGTSLDTLVQQYQPGERCDRCRSHCQRHDAAASSHRVRQRRLGRPEGHQRRTAGRLHRRLSARDNVSTGTDIVATVNGVVANGNGNQLSDQHRDARPDHLGGSWLRRELSAFTITGGGALFQLGPDVVSNQQARLGISSVNTARLGGVSRQVVPARQRRRGFAVRTILTTAAASSKKRSTRSPRFAVGWVLSNARRWKPTSKP